MMLEDKSSVSIRKHILDALDNVLDTVDFFMAKAKRQHNDPDPPVAAYQLRSCLSKGSGGEVCTNLAIFLLPRVSSDSVLL